MRALQRIASPLLLFAAAQLMMGVYAGFYDPSFNNYLSQVHNLSPLARGSLEFSRELPGFLMVFIFALLAFLPDTRIAMVAALLVGMSLWGQGHWAPQMGWVVFWMLIWSVGAHLFLVLKSSIALRLADNNQAGLLLGRLGAVEAGGVLLGGLVLYLGASYFNFSFGLIFGLAGSSALVAGLLLFAIKPQPIKPGTRRLLLKRRYSLFYILNILFGARKQIFLTFAPWVLIKLFNCSVGTFALLGIIGTALGLVFRPLLGRAIDSWGERKIIALESLSLIVICLIYGAAPLWLPGAPGLALVMICFIADQLLIAVNISRATYLNRIAETPEDVAPSLSMGITLDHLISMTVPIGGGIMWTHFGFQWVFWAAAIIALLNLQASFYIPKSPREIEGATV